MKQDDPDKVLTRMKEVINESKRLHVQHLKLVEEFKRLHIQMERIRERELRKGKKSS